MDPFTIASLVAMVAGAGLQYKASQDAQANQQRMIQESLARQTEFQKQAEKKALDTAEQFAPGDRQQKQAEIAQQITENLIQPVSESQAIRSEQTSTQGDVSDDYTTAKAKSDLNVLKQAQALAALLGKTSSASRLRLNEAINMGDTAQGIGQIASFAGGQRAADQIGINQAGNPNAGSMFLGSLLQGAGTAGLMTGAESGIRGTVNKLFAPSSTGTGITTGAAGMGFKNIVGSGTGLKIPLGVG